MVVKVIGTVDDIEVVFKYNQATGKWETIVPRDLDGTYVVDLWAYDEAGNRGYAATVLFTVDTESLHITFKLLDYYLQPAATSYNLNFKPTSLAAVPVDNGYNLAFLPQEYYLERGHECGMSQ